MNNIKEYVNISCVGCRNCEWVCPVKAIHMRYDNEGFLIPFIDDALCIDCGHCKTACVADNVAIPHEEGLCYGFSSSNDELLNISASGGFATMASLAVLEQGGYVCGCVMDENYHVKHIVSNDKQDIYNMSSSKYVQSDLECSFETISNLLKDSKKVLFIGTPCQVHAINLYLGDLSDKLITIDLLCHGTPSPLLFSNYITYLKEKEQSGISDYNFRFKKNGKWGIYCSYIRNRDGKRIIKKLDNDKYGYDFLIGNNYRECCYTCKYRSLTKRPGDITIGDLWGIQSFAKEKYNKKGNSVVVVNSKLGQDFLTTYMNQSDFFLCDSIHIYNNQSSLSDKMLRPAERDTYYNDLDSSFFKNKKNPLTIKRMLIKMIPQALIKPLITLINKRH